MTNSLPAIDAHAHVFQRGLPLSADRRYAPDYDAPVDLYLEQLDRNGLTHGVLVQPSFLGTDNSYLLESISRANGRLRGVAVVDTTVRSDELLRLGQAGVVGIRLNLVGRSLPDFEASEWKSLIRKIAVMGWHVEIQQNAKALAVLIPQLLGFGIQIVLDHFCLPDPREGVGDIHFRDVLSRGKSRNVWVKLSGAYRNGPDGVQLARQLYPRLRDAFGTDRLMWGSDWPHTQFEETQTYEKTRQTFHAIVGCEEDIAAVLSSPWNLFQFDRNLTGNLG